MANKKKYDVSESPEELITSPEESLIINEDAKFDIDDAGKDGDFVVEKENIIKEDKLDFEKLDMEINLINAIDSNDIDWTIKVVNEINNCNPNSYFNFNNTLDPNKFETINKCLLYAIEHIRGLDDTRHLLQFVYMYRDIVELGNKENFSNFIKTIKENIKVGNVYPRDNIVDACRLCIQFKDFVSLMKLKEILEEKK